MTTCHPFYIDISIFFVVNLHLCSITQKHSNSSKKTKQYTKGKAGCILLLKGMVEGGGMVNRNFPAKKPTSCPHPCCIKALANPLFLSSIKWANTTNLNSKYSF
jgi:hypothetical protein